MPSVCSAVRAHQHRKKRSKFRGRERKWKWKTQKNNHNASTLLAAFFLFHFGMCRKKKEQPSTNIETGKSIGSGDQQQKRADRWRTLTVERKMKWNSFSRTHKLKLRLKLPRCRYTLELEAALGSRIYRASMCVKRASASDSVRTCVRLRGEMVKQQTERRKFDERNAPMLANVAFIWTFSFYVYILVFFSLAHFFSRTKLTAALVCCCVFSSGGSFFSSIVECSRGDSISFDDDDDDDEMKWKIFYISPRWVDDDDERDEFIGTGCMSKLSFFWGAQMRVECIILLLIRPTAGPKPSSRCVVVMIFAYVQQDQRESESINLNIQWNWRDLWHIAWISRVISCEVECRSRNLNLNTFCAREPGQ